MKKIRDLQAVIQKIAEDTFQQSLNELSKDDQQNGFDEKLVDVLVVVAQLAGNMAESFDRIAATLEKQTVILEKSLVRDVVADFTAAPEKDEGMDIVA